MTQRKKVYICPLCEAKYPRGYHCGYPCHMVTMSLARCRAPLITIARWEKEAVKRAAAEYAALKVCSVTV